MDFLCDDKRYAIPIIRIIPSIPTNLVILIPRNILQILNGEKAHFQ
jgi:hypothetical protein